MNNSLALVFSTLTFFVFSVILLLYNATIFYIFLGGSVVYVICNMGFVVFESTEKV